MDKHHIPQHSEIVSYEQINKERDKSQQSIKENKIQKTKV